MQIAGILDLMVVMTLGGCVAPMQRQINYGHPALNPPPREVVNDPGRVALGTVVGGLAGSRIGKGEGKLAATALGAALGATQAQGAMSHDTALGALAGGLIGSGIGKGSGRDVAAAIGAGVGAYLLAPNE